MFHPLPRVLEVRRGTPLALLAVCFPYLMLYRFPFACRLAGPRAPLFHCGLEGGGGRASERVAVSRDSWCTSGYAGCWLVARRPLRVSLPPQRRRSWFASLWLAPLAAMLVYFFSTLASVAVSVDECGGDGGS